MYIKKIIFFFILMILLSSGAVSDEINKTTGEKSAQDVISIPNPNIYKPVLITDNTVYNQGAYHTYPNDTSRVQADRNDTTGSDRNQSSYLLTGREENGQDQNLSTYFINASADMGGNITPSGIIVVTGGDSQSFSCTAYTGYEIRNLSIDGNLTARVSTYSFPNVSANHTIRVITSPPIAWQRSPGEREGDLAASIRQTDDGGYIITGLSDSDNCDVSGNHGKYDFWIVKLGGFPQYLPFVATNRTTGITGTSASLNAFLSNTGGNTSEVWFGYGINPSSFTYTPRQGMAAPGQVTVPIANLSPATTYYYNAYASNGNGTVNGSILAFLTRSVVPVANFTADRTQVSIGENVTFTDLSSGEEISSREWNFGDGLNSSVQHPVHQYNSAGNFSVNLTVANQFGVHSLNRADYIHVSGPPAFTINASAGAGGLIVPAGTVPVREGDSHSFTITPKAGYEIMNVTVDGSGQRPLTAYTFSNVTASHTINASFSVTRPPSGKPVIIASSDAGSTIQPSGVIEVSKEGQQTFSIWPAANYLLDRVTVDGSSLGSIHTYTFTNVTADHTITVSSAATGLVAGFNGTPVAGISPLRVAFTDTSLGEPSDWFWRFGDGTSSTDQNPVHVFTQNGVFTVSLSIKNRSGSTIKTERDYISVSEKNWTIIAGAGTGGTITPSGNLTVPEGASLTFTVTPSGGHTIHDTVVDRVSQGLMPSWTFSNINGNHTINAQFSLLGGENR